MKECNCLGFCRGRDGLSDRYKCAIDGKPGKVFSTNLQVGSGSQDASAERAVSPHRSESEKITDPLPADPPSSDYRDTHAADQLIARVLLNMGSYEPRLFSDLSFWELAFARKLVAAALAQIQPNGSVEGSGESFT